MSLFAVINPNNRTSKACRQSAELTKRRPTKNFTSCIWEARKRGKMKQHQNLWSRSPIPVLSCPNVAWPQNGLTSLNSATTSHCEFWAKHLVFLRVSGKLVVVWRWKFCLYLFKPSAHHPSEFCCCGFGGAAGNRGQTNTHTFSFILVDLQIVP